jgi:hypothetical protein
MATEDGFNPGDPLPLFLSADEPEQGIRNDRAVISLRGLKASILAATVIAFGVAAWVGNPMTLSADVAALLGDKSAPQPVTDQSTPMIQSAVFRSTADAEALPPTAKDPPSRETSASEPVSQTQTENGEPSPEALFREFQAWAAEQDARALVKPAQDTPAPVVENVPALVRPVQKLRRAGSVRNARAEIRHANVRRQYERVQARPVQDARVQNQSVQNSEAPSFLQSLNPFAASPSQRGP